MKILAIITEDFSLFYDLVKELKISNIPFVSLSFKDPIPSKVAVVLTTEDEAPLIIFKDKIAIPEGADIKAVINEARRRMHGQETYGTLVIGIDPGVRPGFAVLASGSVIYTTHLGTPEDVTQVAKQIIDLYPAQEVVVRVGHGDPTNRNRLINALADLNVQIEIVDERSTTKRTEFPDIHAAIEIAKGSGSPVIPPLDVVPTNGELKNLQRKSRLISQGRVTISTDLAKRVAKGSLTLEDAIGLQEGKSTKGGGATSSSKDEYDKEG